LLTGSLAGASSKVPDNPGNLLANAGFETGTLSGWTCSAADRVVSSSVHSGSHALRGAASDSDDAQCSQSVSVQPDSSYTLAGWVEGAYVFLGDSGTGANDTSTWTASAPNWQQLSTSFSTGASTTRVTIYVHGWYAQGTYYSDDLSLTGPGSGDSTGPGGSTGKSPSPSPSPVTTTTPRSGGGSGGGDDNRFAVAPYTDMTNSAEPLLVQAAARAGLKAFTAAFVIGSGCTPIWGDTLPVTNDPTVTSEITTAEADGAQPIISFGGEDGAELADTCPTLSQLTAAYQSVIDTLHVTHIDFDIEGAEIADTASNNERFQAINALEAANPGLVVSVTIPVNPNGPDTNGQAFLQEAKANGTKIDVINIMTMDYYGSWDTGGFNMGQYAVEAAQDTLGYAKTLWPGMTYANIGDTPMIGQNDDPAEVFTEADARTLVSFAEQNHLGRLAFWSVDRDQPCGGSASGLPSCSEVSQQPLDFTSIFTSY
jgi:hypothetical protein